MAILEKETITVTRWKVDSGEVRRVLGMAVREARQNLGLTQAEACVMIDVTRTQLCNIELGRSFLSAESLCLAVLHFDLRLDRKFFGAESTPSKPDETNGGE